MQSVDENDVVKPRVDFLWLELTNQCSLQYRHCYAESCPRSEKSILPAALCLELMEAVDSLILAVLELEA